MKLLLCPHCQDVRKLQSRKTKCKCKKVWGKYLPDGVHAQVGGDRPVVLGLNNNDLVPAVKRFLGGKYLIGNTVQAWVIEKASDRVEHLETPPPTSPDP